LKDCSFEKVAQLDSEINNAGRGGERGFRGIAIDRITSRTFIAKNSSIVVLDKKLKEIHEIFHKYFGAIHEVCIYNGILFVTSTAFNSILAFDINTYEYKFGICFKFENSFIFTQDIQISKYDANHLNNICVNDAGIFVCGTGLGAIYCFKNNKMKKFAIVPFGTHNAQPYLAYTLYNDTVHNRIVMADVSGKVIKKADKTIVNRSSLVNYENDRIAKQPFARGLTYTKDLLIGGSSPDMISVYDIKTFKLIKEINMSFDISNTIHGIIVL